VSDTQKVHWALAVSETDWIASRLRDLGDGVTSVVPKGYEAYARIPHPAWSGGGETPVPWRTIAKWNGLEMTRMAQFHSVALSQSGDGARFPYDRGPDEGIMSRSGLEALVPILRRWTSTPEDCLFCIWEGWGCLSLPVEVERGPRVRLPHRDYLLYRGPVETALINVADDPWRQTPNLWWPQDRSWFVGSEIDLTCTYLAGRKGLVDELLASQTPEALPAYPDDPLNVVEPWLQERVAVALDELLETGSTVVSLPVGWVRAEIQREGRGRWKNLTWASESILGGRKRTTSSESASRYARYEDARHAAEYGLTASIIDLAT
jgi:hypothetical protein